MKTRHFFGALAVSALFACSSVPVPPSPAGAPPATPIGTVGQAPPSEALNLDVNQDTIHQTICVSGYTASVRPFTSYTNGVKLKLLREQGLPSTATVDYELDHRVPLALGGHPRNVRNLELQLWEGTDGAKRKDQLERRLQRAVCAGEVLLDEARSAIYWNWQGAYQRYMYTPDRPLK
jgi:hypothetical protein